jgi:hypothetical protein
MLTEQLINLLLDLRHLIRSGYRSVAGKLGPFRAVKTGLGERPKKRGSPEEQNIYRRIQSFYCSIIMTILRILRVL